MPKSPWWGRKVAHLPDHGVLLVSTDLQGNYVDYVALKQIHAREAEAGHDPILLLCGDLVHGPGPIYANPANWPDYLGTFYRDQGVELLLDYEQWIEHADTLALLGNHEHAHIGGPIVSKFHADEAGVLDRALGEHAPRIHDLFRSFPLLAVAPCGAVFTHGAPRATEPTLEDFERLDYGGYDEMGVNEMYEQGTLGLLLWSRYAEPEHARALLQVAHGEPRGFVVFGHDVVRDGYEKVGAEQICVSTSFGCDDRNKTYLRLDLSREYRSVHDLREGQEILPLYPGR
ncbi:metallophosphoesterase [Paraliomyxa miuraensis]|uniref:metallophosphoesterase n=1 Tax=Paraliomyxa miuraensis TaxID=376150 RepID=UPI00224CE68D|nr:metallophosphoesterase [Paraliomyxa miuraensis]MCX4244246.1 serine/threonine protein phosphatase [Paraliomyxa miuraensis]